MKITLTPQSSYSSLALSRAGDTLTINGESFDFSALSEGGLLPREAVDCVWLASDVTREAGVICLALILPYQGRPGPEVLYPVPLVLTEDGPVRLPGQVLGLQDDTD